MLGRHAASTRNAGAAKRFSRKLLRDLQYVPRVIVTDKLRSLGAAKREILPGVEHWQGRYLNNRAVVSRLLRRRMHFRELVSPEHPIFNRSRIGDALR